MQNKVLGQQEQQGQRARESAEARAVGRRLAHRQAAAVEEVERILTAALAVMERAHPASARVADVVTEAGTSLATFYRYFPSKADLVVAVMERGIARLVTYLAHQMEKEDDPRRQVARWIEGVLHQVDDPTAARASLATQTELGRARAAAGLDGDDGLGPVRDLLEPALMAAGAAEPALDAAVIHEAAFGAMRRHLFAGTQPSPGEVDHLVAFCLAGLAAR